MQRREAARTARLAYTRIRCLWQHTIQPITERKSHNVTLNPLALLDPSRFLSASLDCMSARSRNMVRYRRTVLSLLGNQVAAWDSWTPEDHLHGLTTSPDYWVTGEHYSCRFVELLLLLQRFLRSVFTIELSLAFGKASHFPSHCKSCCQL